MEKEDKCYIKWVLKRDIYVFNLNNLTRKELAKSLDIAHSHLYFTNLVKELIEEEIIEEVWDNIKKSRMLKINMKKLAELIERGYIWEKYTGYHKKTRLIWDNL